MYSRESTAVPDPHAVLGRGRVLKPGSLQDEEQYNPGLECSECHSEQYNEQTTQCDTRFGMYTVVAFSSSLDVAAIQMDMGKQLDFNHELVRSLLFATMIFYIIIYNNTI